MTPDNINQRMAWLERKVVELLYAIALGFSMFTGWTVANFTSGEPGWRWDWQIVFALTTMVLFVGVQRVLFRGAPPHIQYIDP